jgi:hypothetical protein
MNVGARYLREIQEVVDQYSHPLGRGTDAMEVTLPLIVEPLRAVFEQGVAEAVDAPKRRAQIVFGFLALRDIADRTGNQDALFRLQRTKADFDWEFAAILTQAVEFKACTHGAKLRAMHVAGEVSRVLVPEAFGNENLDGLIEKFGAGVPK